MVALGMFVLVLSLVFLAFRTTVRLFGEGSMRQSAEQQLNAIRVLLERDTELTSFWLAGVVPRTLGLGESRDGLSMVSLSNWDDAAHFQPGTMRPAWDRQIVWYATQTDPGTLIRQLDAPPPTAPATFLNKPYSLLKPGFSDSEISASKDALSTRYLSGEVKSFKVTSNLKNATLVVNLHLLKIGNARARTGERAENHMHVNWTFCPKNTWPPL